VRGVRRLGLVPRIGTSVDLSSVLVAKAGTVVMAMREMGKSEGARAGTGPECRSGQEVEGEGAYPRGETHAWREDDRGWRGRR
jgi:hypothetical protein